MNYIKVINMPDRKEHTNLSLQIFFRSSLGIRIRTISNKNKITKLDQF